MRRSKSKLFAVVAVAIIAISAFYIYHPFPLAGVSGSHRLGFWLQEGDITNCTWQGGYQQCGAAHPAQLFFNSMFLTSPYPSTVEIMIFAPIQARVNSQGCATTGTGYVGSSVSFWGDLASLANSYPNIQLIYEIAFTPSAPGYDITCFNSMVQAFSGYPSIYGLGVEGEYTTVSGGLTNAVMQTAYQDVQATGKQFINYYIHGVTIPSGGYSIAQTNFPAAGDQVGTLGITGPNVVGISSGYYYSFPFPQNAITCPIGPNVIVTGSVEGWNQCVVSTELSVAVGLPSGTRQFVELDPAFSSSGNFAGVSGQNTNQLWDNPTLRNWIWTDPNYAPNFILSTSAVLPPPSTSTSATSTVTSTSATTITSTSATTITTTSGSFTITTTSTSLMTTTSSTTLTSTMGQPPPSAMNPTVLIAIVVVLGGGAYLLLKRKR